MNFVIVIMASSIASGCKRTTTPMTATTEFRKVAAIIQIQWNPVLRPPRLYDHLVITAILSLAITRYYRRLVSSVGRASVCCAGGRGFEP